MKETAETKTREDCLSSGLTDLRRTDLYEEDCKEDCEEEDKKRRGRLMHQLLKDPASLFICFPIGVYRSFLINRP